MLRLTRLLPSDKLFRGAMLIGSGTIGAQLVTVAMSPVLSRLYAPTDFGGYAVISSLSIVAGAVAGLRLEYAVANAESEDDAAQVRKAALNLSIGICIALTMAVLFFGQWGAERIHVEKRLLWLLPPLAFLTAVGQLFLYHALRQKRRQRVAIASLAQAGTQVAVQLLAGAAGAGAAGLIIGQLFALIAGGAVLAGDARQTLSLHMGWGDFTAVIQRERRFVLLSTPATLFNTSALYLPAVALSVLFGGTVAGIFALCQRVVRLPLALIGTALAHSFAAEAPKLIHTDPIGLRSIVTSSAIRLTGMAIVPALLFGFWAPDLFAWVFGEQWRTAGYYARLLIPALVAQLATAPMSLSLTLAGRQDLQLIWDFVRFALVVAPFAAASVFGLSTADTLLAYSLLTAGAYAAHLLIVMRVLTQLSNRRGTVETPSAPGEA